jgi:SAM-dependent methyltransferase
MVDERSRLGASGRVLAVTGQHDTLLRMAAAENYNAWLLERARPYLGRRTLDVGAGIGTFTELVAPLCERVVAVEADPEFARILERRFGEHSDVEVVRAEAETSLPDGPFDSVVCFNVLEHIAADEAALTSFRARLAAGGALLLLVPAHPLLYGATDRVLGHERRYEKDELRGKLEQAGFSLDVLRHVNPVGALGWLVSARLLRRDAIPRRSLALFDRAVPVLRHLDRLRLPFGLSLWAVAVNRAA